MAKKVFLLYTCNAWKNPESMALVGILGSVNAIKKAITKLIKNKVVHNIIKDYDFKAMTTAHELNNLDEIYVHEGHIGEFESDGGYLV